MDPCMFPLNFITSRLFLQLVECLSLPIALPLTYLTTAALCFNSFFSWKNSRFCDKLKNTESRTENSATVLIQIQTNRR